MYNLIDIDRIISGILSVFRIVHESVVDIH